MVEIGLLDIGSESRYHIACFQQGAGHVSSQSTIGTGYECDRVSHTVECCLAGELHQACTLSSSRVSRLECRFTYELSKAPIAGQPSSFRVRSISVRNIPMARATPAGPPAARP